ncbi:MAG: glycine--tRNA ligase [Candidatus Bathyarchaeota archaeon]|nr:MAG: glycine--tRNA ligase [Candidatus Bathyarchaeota archaeon]
MPKKADKYEAVSELARRRGFFWPSYEIYGGLSGFISYGHLGTVLKRKVEAKFRDVFVTPLNIQEIESSIVMPAKVLEASGHVEAFKEPMVSCRNCERKFRADHLLQEKAGMTDTETEKLSLEEIVEKITEYEITCPECQGELGTPKYFMTMFSTTIGPYSDAVGYGRPEAAQSIFVDFRRIYETARERLPLGVVQIGHALRNEISPRQGPVRLREFTIADIEFFFDPNEPQCPQLKQFENEKLHLMPTILKQRDSERTLEITVREALQKGYIRTEWQAYFMILAKHFLEALGVPEDKQRFIEKLEWERAHYSAQGYDQEVFLDRWGWTEVSGHNYRTDYDLKRHMEHSGVDMQVFREYEKPVKTKRLVVEPILAKIGPVFKKNASKVASLLSQADPKQIEESILKNGEYIIQGMKILPEYVKISHKDIDETGRRFIPHVVEPSFGVDRLVYVTLEYSYERHGDRTLLKLPRELAPIQISIFPLVRKDGLAKKAKLVSEILAKEDFAVEYDEAGSIGRRYARADEAGTPLCITVDYQSLKDDSVTIRDRDSWKQSRTGIKTLVKSLRDYYKFKKDLEDMGELL